VLDGRIRSRRNAKKSSLFDAVCIDCPPLRLGRSESRRTREAARRRPDRQLTGDAAHDKTTVDALRVALKGKTIGISPGTVYTKFIDTNFKDVATIREYKTAPEHDLDLVAGRMTWHSTTARTGLGIHEAGKQGPRVHRPEDCRAVWARAKHWPSVCRQGPEGQIDQGIAAALADGTVKRLSLKWLKVDARLERLS